MRTAIVLLALSASGCVVAATTDPCAGVFCGSGRVCRSGACVDACATLPGGCTSPQPTYAACSSSVTCATPNTCYSVTTTATTGGSYCSSTCGSSTECEGSGSSLGAACLMLASAPGSPFLCYHGCATDLDCLAGNSCIPVTGGAVGHVCMPGSPVAGGQPTYASCNGGLTCATDDCISVTTPMTTGGSFCSDTCGSSSECPGVGSALGAACLMLASAPSSPFVCYPGCATDANCQSGTSCIPITGGAVGHVCMPGSAIASARLDYDICSTSSDCASNVCAQTTVTTTSGGTLSGHQCTQPCGSSSECPDRNGMGSACLMIAGTASAFYCYQGCTFDTDCPGPNGVCTPVTGGAVGHVCFPQD